MSVATKAIIFDVDGVLADCTEIHFAALNRALGLFGFGITHEDHLARFNGLPTSEKLKMLDVPAALKPLIAEMKQKYTRQLMQQQLRPDYQKTILLAALAARGYRLACASNALRQSVEQMLTLMQLRGYFGLVVGADDVARAKPDPEIYLHALNVLDVAADECVIVEDAPYGIAAARASGARVIEVVGVRDVHTGLFLREGLL